MQTGEELPLPAIRGTPPARKTARVVTAPGRRERCRHMRMRGTSPPAHSTRPTGAETTRDIVVAPVAAPGRPLVRPARSAGGDSRAGDVVVVLEPKHRRRPLAVDDRLESEGYPAQQARADPYIQSFMISY